MAGTRIILASASPRRRELMTQMGLEFEVITSDCDENIDETNPAELVRELALRKAMAVADCLPENEDYVVVGADTVVALGDKILGKPASHEDAVQTLLALSNKSHSVFTGLAVVTPAKTLSDFCETKISFVDISLAEAEAYVATGEPLDKAGSYGIQGRGGVFVSAISGDYYSTVGLPICKLNLILRSLGVLA